MKKLGKKLLRIFSLAIALCLAAVIYPYASQWLSAVLPKGKYDRETMLISHEMEKAGELTAIRYTDQELMEASTKALLVGEVQNVKVPYTYEIGLGLRLADVRVETGENGIILKVPDAQMLYDSFKVTGSPEVYDFYHLYPLNETRYQEMLDAQAAACRESYLQNAGCMEEAWNAACEQIKALVSQWTGETLPLTFERLRE